jgi:hypothetical protein
VAQILATKSTNDPREWLATVVVLTVDLVHAPAFVEHGGTAYLAIGFEWHPGSGMWRTAITESGDSPAVKGNVGIRVAVRMSVVNDIIAVDVHCGLLSSQARSSGVLSQPVILYRGSPFAAIQVGSYSRLSLTGIRPGKRVGFPTPETPVQGTCPSLPMGVPVRPAGVTAANPENAPATIPGYV